MRWLMVVVGCALGTATGIAVSIIVSLRTLADAVRVSPDDTSVINNHAFVEMLDDMAGKGITIVILIAVCIFIIFGWGGSRKTSE
jgi:Trk-type K+ transport system membrane component